MLESFRNNGYIYISKLGQLALKIISLRVIRKLIIVIKYVTKGVNFGVTA